MQPPDETPTRQQLAEAVLHISDLARQDEDIHALNQRMVARHGSLAGFAAAEPELFGEFYESVVEMAALDERLAKWHRGGG